MVEPSFLQKQQAGFSRTVKAVAHKVGGGNKTLAPPAPVSAPSPAASNASSTSKAEEKDLKRKREATNVVFSQPAATGFGNNITTQVTYVIDFLKKKDEPKTLLDILGYLSVSNVDSQKQIAGILKKHSRVTWTPDQDTKKKSWDSGTYTHNPIINVRNKQDLIGYLQQRVNFAGVSVKELKDGWPDCEESLNELEREHKLLVTRTKKDNHARMVWLDDASLHVKVDDEFKILWQKVDLPSVDDTVRKLLDAGQKPASEDPSKRIKLPPKPKEKKKKVPRKGGRTTNTHMAHLLKDFSDRRLG